VVTGALSARQLPFPAATVGAVVHPPFRMALRCCVTVLMGFSPVPRITAINRETQAWATHGSRPTEVYRTELAPA